MAKTTTVFSVKDTKAFKGLLECVTSFLSDERIDESIRREHYDKIVQFFPVEGGIQ